MENLVMPEGLDFRNGGQHCDMLTGPCACGAWHRLDDLPYRIFNQLKAEKAQPRPEQAQGFDYAGSAAICDSARIKAQDLAKRYGLNSVDAYNFILEGIEVARPFYETKAQLAALRRERDSLNQLYTLANDHVTDLRRELEQAKEILWDGIDDKRDDKLSLKQVAAKASNGLYWAHREITDLRTRLAEAEKDTARLDCLEKRFLRQIPATTKSVFFSSNGDFTLRQAIDSARAQDKEGK